MLGKDDKKIGSLRPQFCGECGEKCAVAYPHPTDDVVYCREHYEALVAPVCEGCNRGVVGEVTKANGKSYHPACYNTDHSCVVCSRPIVGESFVALSRNYHKQCWKCTAYAQAARRLAEGTGASVITTGDNKEVIERNKLKTDLHANVQGGKETCSWCRKQLGSASQAIQFDGKVFHEDCFACAKCGNTIGNDQFVNKQGVAYCRGCGATAAVNCHGCSKAIESTYTIAAGSKYHPKCLVCNKCKSTLEKGFIESEGNIFCGPCGRTAPTGSFSQTPQAAPGRTKGFTIDPRSGKKTFL
eukprot:gene4363-5098_t